MATTRRNVTRRTNELIRRMEKVAKERVKHLLDSGAVELSDWNDDYKLPKMMLAAIYERLVELEMTPPHPSRRDNKELRNFKAFV